MKRNCPKCDQLFREGDEVRMTAFAYWHEIPSSTTIATTKPHEAIPETIEHRNCREANDD
jgi:hypothetical protein